MSLNNNTWEVAEAYLAGRMTEAECKAVEGRLAADAAFAAEFQESVNLISSMEGSGKQKRFRAMLRDVQARQAAIPAKKPRNIVFTPQMWRTAAVAAGVAILTSTITIWSLKPSMKKTDSQYSTISREVEHIKKVQAGQQAEQNQLKEIIKKNAKPTPPPSDVRYTGTGFALTNDGYFVTAYHVIGSDFDSVYIQTHDGLYYKAFLLNYSKENDIAILKVEKKNFRFGKGELPYTFAAEKTGLGSRIFTLGYPKDVTVYSEGYISGKNGYEGNDQQYTLQLPAGHGQSGSPVVDEKGNILGLLTAISTEAQSNTYAVSSKSLITLLHTGAANDIALRLPKANKMGRMSRQEQIEKMEAYTFSVKVYKK